MKHTQQLITRRAFVAGSSVAVAGVIIANRSIADADAAGPFQAMGTRAGEVTDTTAIVSTRLTAVPVRNNGGVIIPKRAKEEKKRGKSASDFFPTFADLGGAKLPEGVKLDGHSFAPQLRGERGTPRDWVYVQLGDKWYVRNQGFKLTSSGDLLDMSDAPFSEKAASNEAEKAKLQAVLKELNPAGTGKHAAEGELKPRKEKKQ